MKNSLTLEMVRPLTLQAETAAEMMTPNPVSIRDSATIQDAVTMLTDKGFSAAPVIDRAGRPIGVLSRADIIVHDRERPEYVAPVPDYYEDAAESLPSGERVPKGMHLGRVDSTLVSDIMTPVVFSVAPSTPAPRVVEDMVSLKVHRLFVVDESGILVGVISALDVLRNLKAE